MDKNFDVIIVGMGPSGLVLGGLLANYGISVGIFEKKESTVTEPRAVSIDDETLRTLQSFSCLLYTSPSPRDATLSRMPSSA